jgi:hypothetical protein
MFVDNGKQDTYRVNQLQYVNRQLRKETAGLEIQYSYVHFETYPKANSTNIHGFLVFAGSCTPTRFTWLTHVVLDPGLDREITTGPKRGDIH